MEVCKYFMGFDAAKAIGLVCPRQKRPPDAIYINHIGIGINGSNGIPRPLLARPVGISRSHQRQCNDPL